MQRIARKFLIGNPTFFLILAAGLIIVFMQSLFQSLFQSEDFLLIITGAMCLFFSSLLMHNQIAVLNVRQMTIPGFWFLTYIIMIFFPSFFIFFDHPGPYRYRYLFGVEATLVAVGVGILLINRISGFTRRDIKEYYGRPLSANHKSPHFFLSYLFFALLALGLSYLHATEVSEMPFLYLLTNPGAAAITSQLREEAYAALDSSLAYAYFLLKSFLYPLLVSIALGRYMASRKKTWLFIFVIMFFAGIGYTLMTTHKSFVAILFLVLFFFIYLYRCGYPRMKFVIGFVCLTIVFPVSMFFLLFPEQGIQAALKNVFFRLFQSPAEMVYYYYEIFPDIVGYLYGRNIGKIAWLFNLDFFDATRFVSYYLSEFTLEVGSANASFVGDAYANFGLVGVLLEGILVGLIMQGVQIYIFRREKNVLSLSLYAFMITAFSQLHSASLQVVLLSDGVIFSLFVYWLIRTIEGFLYRSVGSVTI